MGNKEGVDWQYVSVIREWNVCVSACVMCAHVHTPDLCVCVAMHDGNIL